MDPQIRPAAPNPTPNGPAPATNPVAATQPLSPQPPVTPQPARPSFPAPPANARKKRKGEGWRSILSTFIILLIAPIIALLLTAFVFQSYEVDGPSMEVTLQNHDRLIVSKVPRTWARITGHAYTPNRGDIIIFVAHNLHNFNDPVDEKQLIKRVVGLPGERVVVKDGVLTVFNKEHPSGFQPDAGTPYIKAAKVTPGNVDVTVKAGQVFVSGDNRTNSLDSRAFGPVDSSDIVGKLMVRVFPMSNFKLF